MFYILQFRSTSKLQCVGDVGGFEELCLVLGTSSLKCVLHFTLFIDSGLVVPIIPTFTSSYSFPLDSMGCTNCNNITNYMGNSTETPKVTNIVDKPVLS